MKLLLGRKSSIWNSREKIILLLIQKVSLLTNNPHFACLGQPLVSRKLLFKLQPQKRKKQTQRNLREGFTAACNHFESSFDFPSDCFITLDNRIAGCFKGIPMRLPLDFKNDFLIYTLLLK